MMIPENIILKMEQQAFYLLEDTIFKMVDKLWLWKQNVCTDKYLCQ